MIDLHAHTKASDGDLEPEALVRLAVTKGLTAIAITDHDTFEGIPEALQAGRRFGIKVIPGIELSIEFDGPKIAGKAERAHLLVYYPPLEGRLFEKVETLKRWRRERNVKIIAKLNKLGVDITLEEVVATSSGAGQLGKPHFARVLLNKGVVKDWDEAFSRFLGAGAPADIEKKKLSMRESLKLARSVGAIPVVAHPHSINLPQIELRERIQSWSEMGLLGIETIYPKHDPAFRKELVKIAGDLSLIQTGGSDFHGSPKPDVELGSGIGGNINVPDSFLAELNRVHSPTS
jgi:3',5'-nucleoside bisphosphate phosphatase